MARRPPSSSRARSPRPTQPSTAVPALGNRFDPAAIYARRAPGVVTLYADLGADGQAQGSGFVVDAKGTILTNAHVVTNVAERSGGTVQGRREALRRVPRRRPRAGDDHRLGPVQRCRRRPRRPRRARAGARSPRPLVHRRRRDARGGDRQPLRRAELALGRGRLGHRSDDRLAHVGLQRRRCDPDRRPDQPRQLRRAALRRAGTRDRDQCPDPLDERQRRRRRLRDPDRHRQACPRPAAADGEGRVCLRRGHDPGRDARAREEVRPRLPPRRPDREGRARDAGRSRRAARRHPYGRLQRPRGLARRRRDRRHRRDAGRRTRTTSRGRWRSSQRASRSRSRSSAAAPTGGR